MGTDRSAVPRALVDVILAGLALQLLLGMWVNLWIVVPASHPGAHSPSYFAGLIPAIAWALGSAATMLRLHVALGVLLFLASGATLYLAIRSGRRAWVWTASIGFVAVTGAAFNGASFINYGHGFSSYLMTVGLVIALAAYVIGMWATR